MKSIHSGTTPGRIIRTVLLMALLCGYAGWSLVDGYIRYPRQNVESVLHTQLGIEPSQPLPVAHPKLTEQSVPQIAEGERFDAVAARFEGRPFRYRGQAYYFGYGGYVRLEVEHGRIAGWEWTDGPKRSATDMRMQKVIGFGLIPVGLVFLVQLVRVLMTRVSLTEAGLKVRGKPLVPFEAMTGLRAGKSAGLSPGIVVVDYAINDRPATVRLDAYVVSRQDAIVAAICKKKGFDNPTRSADTLKDEG